jgi:hypothetical protein
LRWQALQELRCKSCNALVAEGETPVIPNPFAF